MNNRSIRRQAFVVPVCVVVVALIGHVLIPSSHASHAAGMDAMSIDVTVAGNTPTFLGSRQDCVQSTAGASMSIDITAAMVPGSNSMLGYAYKLNYPADIFTISAQDSAFMLASNEGSLLVNTSDPLPDDNVDNAWSANLLDGGLGSPETGSGVLDRLTIQVEPAAAPGLYFLSLTNHGHIGQDSLATSPDRTFNASIAIGVPCDSDGDGWNDGTEMDIGTLPQQNCGHTAWPADLVASGSEGSTLNIVDLASFVAPIDRLNTNFWEPGYSPLWDLAPGSNFGKHINVTDMSTLVSGITGYPPMFGGQKAFNRSCSFTSPTSTPSASPTPTNNPTPTPTSTPTPSPLPTPSPSPTLTPTPSPVPTASPTPTPSSGPSPTPSPTPGTLTLNPVDDAYVAGDIPTANFGQMLDLQSDTNPTRESYLKFDLRVLGGRPISLARLRMFVIDRSGVIQNVNQIDVNGWTEDTLTFNNRPPHGSLLTTFAPGANGWIEVNITPYITAKLGSFASLAIVATGGNSYGFNSAEATTGRVELVIDHGGTPTPSPSPVPTPSATSTPSPLPTPTPSATPTPSPPATPSPPPTSSPSTTPTSTPTPSQTPTPPPTPSPPPTSSPSTTPTATPTPSQTPTPSLGAPFSFGVVGDLGQTSNTAAVLDAVNTSGVNFFLAIGDLSYVSGSQENAWCTFVKGHVGATYPFELIAGNHEDDGPDGQINNFAACLPHRLGTLNGTYGKEYYFDYPATNPRARFINISPDLSFPGEGTWDYTTGSARYNWTASAIDSARAAGIKWVIVSMHKYCIAMTTAAGCEVSSDLMNLLIDEKVDLYFQGHDHAYARGKQLAYRTGCAAVSPGSFDADCVIDGSSPYAAGAGTVIVTAGMGGQSINSVNTGDPEAGYFASWMGSNAEPTFGFLKVTVTATSLTAQFVRAAGGSYSDSFTIQ